MEKRASSYSLNSAKPRDASSCCGLLPTAQRSTPMARTLPCKRVETFDAAGPPRPSQSKHYRLQSHGRSRLSASATAIPTAGPALQRTGAGDSAVDEKHSYDHDDATGDNASPVKPHQTQLVRSRFAHNLNRRRTRCNNRLLREGLLRVRCHHSPTKT